MIGLAADNEVNDRRDLIGGGGGVPVFAVSPLRRRISYVISERYLCGGEVVERNLASDSPATGER